MWKVPASLPIGSPITVIRCLVVIQNKTLENLLQNRTHDSIHIPGPLEHFPLVVLQY